MTPLEIGYLPHGGSLEVITAGRPGVKYDMRLRYFSWSEFNDRLQGAEKLAAIFEWARLNYDYVLLDSRAARVDASSHYGFAQAGGLVVCFNLDEDAIRAAGRAADSMRAKVGDALLVYPVPMRVRVSEHEGRVRMTQFARAVFAHHLARFVNASDYWDDVAIPEHPQFTFGHVLPPLAEADADRLFLTSAMRLTRTLTEGGVDVSSPPIRPDARTLPPGV